ncbi:hypothetical protein GJAV_G00268850 [Gymnothorax javanicus]|nr:hypothetical protein GJAV_G00268850 [Gymnothorax javanicus]
MPRRKQKRHLKSKGQLEFVQAPLDGAFHPYGPKVRGARNPRIFLAAEHRQSSTACSWVAPQFDASISGDLIMCRGRGIKKSYSSRRAVNNSSLLCLPRPRKTASVCKFPSLSFEKHPITPPRPPFRGDREKVKLGRSLVEDCTQEPAGRGSSSNVCAEMQPCVPSPGKGGVEGAGDFQLTPNAVVSCTNWEIEGQGHAINTPMGRMEPTCTGFTPRHVETPDMSEACRTSAGTDASLWETGISKLRLLFPETPTQGSPPPVLVSDTPEEHYGENWRRNLLNFLSD